MNDTFLDCDNFRQNNFGALRLLLAIAVLFSHTFAAYVGGHEFGEHFHLMTCGQMDLGSLAVNMFFAISGYLITLSWLRTPQFKTFIVKRLLRIYPGFIVASLISLLIIAPLSGAQWSVAFTPFEIAKSIGRLALLSGPKAIGSFATEPYPVLNMSLWTIRYEFICYLIVPLLVLALSRFKSMRVGIAITYVVLLGWHVVRELYFADVEAMDLPIIGAFDTWPRFATYFLGGMVLAVNRDVVPFRDWIACLCLGVTLATAAWGGFVIATATAGIYLIFYAAYQRKLPLFRVAQKVDLSYGVYLYAWPVQMLLMQNLRHLVGPWTIFVIALPATLLVAALSWRFVEEPFLRAKARLTAAPLSAEPVTPQFSFTHVVLKPQKQRTVFMVGSFEEERRRAEHNATADEAA